MTLLEKARQIARAKVYENIKDFKVFTKDEILSAAEEGCTAVEFSKRKLEADYPGLFGADEDANLTLVREQFPGFAVSFETRTEQQFGLFGSSVLKTYLVISWAEVKTE